MKRGLFFMILCCCLTLLSCRNETVQLLSKKWDCVKVDNILPQGIGYLSLEDSVNSMLLQSALQNLSWTFKKNMGYECALGNTVTVKGKYELQGNDKIIILTPESKSNSNRYIIISLTEYEMILSGRAENRDLVFHFKPS